jgi:hypothetical protein
MLTFRKRSDSLHLSIGNLRLSNHRPVIEFFSNQLSIPAKSLDRNAGHLRKSNLAPPSKRGFGALDYDTTAGVNLFAGSILASSNSKVVETVQGIRSRHMTSAHFNSLTPDAPPEGRVQAAFNSVRDLGIHLIDRHTVGTMLDRVVDTMRSGVFAKWAGADGDVIVDFHDGGRGTLIYFDRHVVNEAAVFSFDADKNAEPPPIEHMTRVSGRALRGLAAALGPLPLRSETAIPPPPC